jgi:hypothetical protein
MFRTLSILLRTDSLSYIHFDDNGRIESFNKHTYNRNDNISLFGVLASISAEKVELGSVVVGLDHSMFTIVPEPLYNRAHWYEYLSCVHPDLLPDEVCSIPALNERFVFQFDIHLRKALSDHFPGFAMYHIAAAYWIYYTDKQLVDDRLYLILRNYYLYLIGGENNRITLLNRFYAPTENDALYYCLLACKEFKRSPNDVIISITSNKPEINRRFEKYFKRVIEMDPIMEAYTPINGVEPPDLMDHFYLYYANNRREIQRSTIPPAS